jgi:hypothetical protein
VSQGLERLGPRLFESLRSFLHASPEQRSNERWPCTRPLHVYPILADQRLGEVIEGVGKDVSRSGVSFRVAEPLTADQVYLHWHELAAVAPYAVLAQVKRVEPAGADGYEIGAAFPLPAAGPSEPEDPLAATSTSPLFP